jgi:NADH:ubiquinone oxidoreductase subunit E
MAEDYYDADDALDDDDNYNEEEDDSNVQEKGKTNYQKYDSNRNELVTTKNDESEEEDDKEEELFLPKSCYESDQERLGISSRILSLLNVQIEGQVYIYDQYCIKYTIEQIKVMKNMKLLQSFDNRLFISDSQRQKPLIKDDCLLFEIRQDIIRENTKYDHELKDDSTLSCSNKLLKRIQMSNKNIRSDYFADNGFKQSWEYIQDYEEMIIQKLNESKAHNLAKRSKNKRGKKKTQLKQNEVTLLECVQQQNEEVSGKNEDQMAERLSISPRNGLFNEYNVSLNSTTALSFNIVCSSDEYDTTNMNVNATSNPVQRKDSTDVEGIEVPREKRKGRRKKKNEVTLLECVQQQNEEVSGKNEEQMAERLSISPRNGLFNEYNVSLNSTTALSFNIVCSSDEYDTTNMNVNATSNPVQRKDSTDVEGIEVPREKRKGRRKKKNEVTLLECVQQQNEEVSGKNEEQMAERLSISPRNGLFNEYNVSLNSTTALSFNIVCSSDEYETTNMNVNATSNPVQRKDSTAVEGIEVSGTRDEGK